MAIFTTAVTQKIESFYRHGFLSGEALQKLMAEQGSEQTIKTSYDIKLRTSVPLNCISAIRGISFSLYHPAKGGLVVMMEERIGDRRILDQTFERNKNIIDEVKKDFPPTFSSAFVLKAVRGKILSNDIEFLQHLSEQCHRTALFVLNLEVEKNENTSDDDCFETGRKFIPPHKIQAVILPKQYTEEHFNQNINKISCDSVLINNFTFCYKDETGQAHQVIIEKPILMPNYQQALIELAKNRELKNHPYYTHMTRLF